MNKKWISYFKPVKVNIAELDDRTLLLNLYVTQGLILLSSIIVMIFQTQSLTDLLMPRMIRVAILWGTGLAVLIITLELIIMKWLPKYVLDDGGINDKVFKQRPVWHIAIIAFVVAICEELLFRGVLQHGIGLVWASVIFTAIHFRYLKHWFPAAFVFSISMSLGWVYQHTETLWTPIIAHFLIDFVLGCIIRFRRQR